MDADAIEARRIMSLPTIGPTPEREPRRGVVTMKSMRFLLGGVVKAVREQLAERDVRIAALEARCADLEQRLAEAEARKTLRIA